MTAIKNDNADIDGLAEELNKLGVNSGKREPSPTKVKPEPKPKKQLTPYQGDSRTFGYFRCEDCLSDWSSAYSWADTAQKCEVCRKFRFPYRQVPFYSMYKGGGRGNGKPHREPSCGKCLQIRSSCTKLKSCNERPECFGPIVGLAEATTQNTKPKRKRKPKSKQN